MPWRSYCSVGWSVLQDLMRTELSKGRPDKEIGRPIMAGQDGRAVTNTTAPTGSDVPLAANVADMQISEESASMGKKTSRVHHGRT